MAFGQSTLFMGREDKTMSEHKETAEPTELEREIEAAINRACAENASNTPDFILARFLVGCLNAFNGAVQRRERWYGRDPDVGPAGIPAGPIVLDKGMTVARAYEINSAVTGVFFARERLIADGTPLPDLSGISMTEMIEAGAIVRSRNPQALPGGGSVVTTVVADRHLPALIMWWLAKLLEQRGAQ